jgi:phosphoglycolate phosphatase-like HAD superfamily hydrolase
MIKLIIFDWDDVIVQGAKVGYYNCYRETLRELGVKLDEKEMDIRIKRKWGQPYRTELLELLKEDPSHIDQACDIYQKHKFGATYIDSLHEVFGVNDVLLRLKDKYTLAVATANQPKILEKVMAKFSIPSVFAQIVTAYDTNVPPEKTKPHPHMLELILNKQHIDKSEALFIGDAKSDVQMAFNAGVEPVVVLTGHLSKEEAESLHVKHILADVTKIEEIL